MTESEYTYLMETNEDDGDVSAFLEFSAAMDRASNDWELVQVRTPLPLFLGPLPLFLGPRFRLAARWNRLVETVKTRKKREKTGKKWARYSLKRVKVGS